MKTLAAILVELGRPLELVDLEIPPLQPGQVLVEVAVSGVCHTQLLEVQGRRGPDPFLPHCLGHEGSGIVREIGAGVEKCRPGEHVVLSWLKGRGADVPATLYQLGNRTVNAGGVTTFSRWTVVSENRVTVIPEELAFRDAAWMGCAMPTGIGAVWNTANVQEGASVAVFGTGGIGLFAVAGAARRGGSPIFGLDLNPRRLELAVQFGAAITIRNDIGDPLDAIRQRCPRGVDVAIEATGRPEVMRQALASVRPQGGKVVVIGNAPFGATLEIDPRELNQGKQLLGTWGGDCRPDRDFPLFCELILHRMIDLSPFATPPYRLIDIQQALDDLEHGMVARPWIDMSL